MNKWKLHHHYNYLEQWMRKRNILLMFLLKISNKHSFFLQRFSARFTLIAENITNRYLSCAFFIHWDFNRLMIRKRHLFIQFFFIRSSFMVLVLKNWPLFQNTINWTVLCEIEGISYFSLIFFDSNHFQWKYTSGIEIFHWNSAFPNEFH